MLFHPLQRRFRARRMALLARTLGINSDTRVLDVGGTIDIWRVAPVMPRLVLLNSQRARYEIGAAEAIVLGDRALVERPVPAPVAHRKEGQGAFSGARPRGEGRPERGGGEALQG